MIDRDEEDEMLELLYGSAPAPQTHPELAQKRRAAASRPRDKGYDRAYEHRRAADPVLAERFRVRKLTDKLVRIGYIPKQPCEVCGESKADAHHTDYRDPMAIIWLCRAHHALHHGAQRRREERKARRAKKAQIS